MQDTSSPRPQPQGRDNRKLKTRSTIKSSVRWAAKLFFLTIFVSALLTFLSSEVMGGVGYTVAFLVLAFFIVLGIVFDILGVAVTSAVIQPFNSMASRKVAGAREAILLVKSADKVSSFCNDVVGDISGIISGSTGAIITASLVNDFSVSMVVIQLAISGIVSGLTVGGKALGKSFAIDRSTGIVHFAGRIIHFFRKIFPSRMHKFR